MKRILIDCKPDHKRVAITEGSALKELVLERNEAGSLVGRVILGVVQNILPSQFAFIDIGRERNAFMNLNAAHGLKQGQPVLVQVYKDASGAKGANVGQKLHFNGRYVILFESGRTETGVSQKITNEAERKRLRKILKEKLPPGYGAIARTNSEGKDAEAIGAEAVRLAGLHRQLVERAQYLKPPAIVHQEDLLINDFITDDLSEIWVNDAAALRSLWGSLAAAAPELQDRLFLYDETDGQTLFDHYGLEHQITRALEKSVWLPCGGFITIEQTEACVIVDVNTGKFPGKRNYRETVLQTNLEAAECIAEQLRLRNLSGMIIVDFIDMYVEEDKKTLINAFTKYLQKDRIKSAIVGMTELGLVQLTRRKTREPLGRLLERDCPHCRGTGRIKL